MTKTLSRERVVLHTADQTSALHQLVRSFQQLFATHIQPQIFQAPGRVNLIGEHTDYNDGFVMPAAIDFHTWIAAAPRQDSTLAVHSVGFGQTKTFDLRDTSPHAEQQWSDYVRGVTVELQREGIKIPGANLFIQGNVPIGSGLSSSASLEIATAYALLRISRAEMPRRHLALLCQRAENEFVGARVGIMDQFVSATGRFGHALMLDCRSLDYELLPLPQGVPLVICNTGVKHKLADGEYNVRRRECEQGVAILRQRFPDIKSLRDVSSEMLADGKGLLPPVVYRRCLHVVGENARVAAAAMALRNSDLPKFGQLMYQSHDSLRYDYEVSCPELDLMVALASRQHGVVGARMTGGGFGGCTINLVEESAVEQFRTEVAKAYHEKTGMTPQIYITSASDGASEISVEGNR